MANNKNPNEKQPGEKPEGAQHYNPGNQSGKGPVRREDSEKPDTRNETDDRGKHAQR